MPLKLAQVLRRCLADPEAGWSMGSFGALAEFHQDAGEAAEVDQPAQLTRATARGAIRIGLDALPDCTPVAFEIPSPRPTRWSHGIALCLPAETARCSNRTTLTELGQDHDAIRTEDREAVLFDLGLGLTQSDFCVRTSDVELLRDLRQCAGRPILGTGHPAMHAILRKHPHRVAMTRLGRVEVFQKIGGPDTGGRSPPGPHTHVLPKLLASGRTHAANTPVPDGLVPCAYVHPGNPVVDALGHDRAFESRLHDAFQALMLEYGPKDLVATKSRLVDHLLDGADASSFELPNDRHHRAIARVALRQLARAQEQAPDARTASRIDSWRRRFDPIAEPVAGDNDAGHD